MGRASKRKRKGACPRAERVAKRAQVQHDVETKRRWAAYHEAAHALVGLAMGQDVRYVEIYCNGGGYTQPASPDWFKALVGHMGRGLLTAEQCSYVYGRLVSTVAAMDMEHGLQQVMGFALPQQDDHDRRASVGWASLLAAQEGCREEAHAILQRALQDAHTALSQNADAIVQIAELLYAQGRLTGEEIKAHGPIALLQQDAGGPVGPQEGGAKQGRGTPCALS